MTVRETSSGGTGTEPFIIRPLSTNEDFVACVALQRWTWGDEFREVVHGSLLKVAQKVGGVAAGAFGPDGALWGFVFGLTGIEAGRPVHWSHMLAVRPDVRDRGVGRRLKEFQRAWLRERQVSRVYWTFDPLVARNAHLNLNRLGVEVVEFIPDMYGPETGSPLHAGLGTDRLLVAWHLDDVPVDATPPPFMRGDGDGRGAISGTGEIRVEIPSDIQTLKETDRRSAIEWRDAVRAAFSTHLTRGCRVIGLERESGSERCAYVLARSDVTRPARAEDDAVRVQRNARGRGEHVE